MFVTAAPESHMVEKLTIIQQELVSDFANLTSDDQGRPTHTFCAKCYSAPYFGTDSYRQIVLSVLSALFRGKNSLMWRLASVIENLEGRDLLILVAEDGEEELVYIDFWWDLICFYLRFYCEEGGDVDLKQAELVRAITPWV
ncbi:hypothetical protein CDAR_434561 [Caerostris darwini]|uniref:Uncharacterized protein n=1 Tax=Caerostris darwini TaxID=1538125 RepID=A0AAV4PKH5_9ARAC|nr:hypothetical protein CDAR_434561 [Caerostris darwini]